MPAAAAFLLAAAVAAGSLDPARVALGHALGDELSAGCTATELHGILRDADISALGSVGGRKVVLASPHGGCICGNVNCPFFVLRLDPGGAAAVLLDTSGYGIQPVGRAQPLPNLRELAHDSALISDETLDAFRGGKYVVIGTARIRSDNGARKANQIPIRFTPGTSSATLTGTVSEGWYDEYALGAAQGQHITVAGPSGLTYSLTSRTGASSIELKPGIAAVLPVGGSYLLHIDGGGEGQQAYRATVTIR
jgi:hypothetical protein